MRNDIDLLYGWCLWKGMDCEIRLKENSISIDIQGHMTAYQNWIISITKNGDQVLIDNLPIARIYSSPEEAARCIIDYSLGRIWSIESYGSNQVSYRFPTSREELEIQLDQRGIVSLYEREITKKGVNLPLQTP